AARPLDEAVARVSVVVDTVLRPELTNELEGLLAMRAGDAIAERLERVQQGLFDTRAHAHALVDGEVGEQAREPRLEAHGHVDALDLERRPRARQSMPEYELVAVGIADSVVAEAPWPVLGRAHDLDAGVALEREELVRVADDEVDGAAFGARRP